MTDCIFTTLDVRRCASVAALVLGSLGLLQPREAQASTAPALVLVGDKDYAPLSYLDGGVAKGLDVDVALAIGRALGRPARIALMDWSDAQREVLEGRADGLLSMGIVLLLGAAAAWVVMLKREIRARQRIESDRRKVEARVRLLAHALHAANDCVTITDASDHIVYANAAFLRTYDYDERDVLGRHVSILRPESDRGGAVGPPETSDWETWRGELWNRSGSGRLFPVSLTASIVRDEQGQRIAAIGVARDMTNEKLAAEALRASEARYRELVENANDAVFTVDRDGYCRSMNRAGQEMSGCVADDPRGVHIDRLLLPQQAAFARAQLERVLEGQILSPFELTLVNKEGTPLTVELALRAVAQAGAPVAAQGIARDVTIRKELEVQVIQSQKMQAIGQLAAGIAHDFNNLMTVILGNCQEARALAGPSHPVQSQLDDVRQAAERATSLTGQLLAFSRRQMMQPRILRLDEVIADTERMLTRLIGEDIDLHVERDADLGLVSIDAGQLQQILLNLTVNARDAMPQGGRLIVETRNVRLDEVYAARRRRVPSGDYVMLAVSDNGTGMDERTRARLFEPFFTTKEVGKGTGLGLSTVYGIVEQSGGFICVYSEPGLGSTFKIYFPRVQGRPEPVPAGAISNAPRRGNEVVLLVEDERAVRELLSRYLATQGYTILTAHNGEDAITLCRTERSAPALLITDVVMPGMNGPALASALRLSYPSMKVLYLSGYTDDAVLRNGILPSGTHFQQKPFALDALTRKIRDIIDDEPGPTSSGAATRTGHEARTGGHRDARPRPASPGGATDGDHQACAARAAGGRR